MVIVKTLGLTTYQDTWRAMQAFTAQRQLQTPDELWLTEHPPVYTLGLNKKEVRLPARTDIPLVETDRGGKITYHGPGQIIVYLLLDLKRKGWSVRQLVSHMENAVVDLLAEYAITAYARADAPGVYVNQKKIASLGLRLKHGCCYHGVSLNIDMDLSPFSAIDPCGYRGMEVTQAVDLGISEEKSIISQKLLARLSL